MFTTKILAIVMAGGEGSRLNPLTARRSKPSIPFGARYRIVDFVLSTLVNTEILTHALRKAHCRCDGSARGAPRPPDDLFS